MVSMTSLRRGWSVLGARGLLTAARQRVTWTESPERQRLDALIKDARVLEVGGPSSVFRADGIAPVYPSAGSIDNVNFTGETIWEHGLTDGGDYAPAGTHLGTQYLREATDLKLVGKYDAVISSHTIEHTANPLKALREWHRLTPPGGHLLMVLPHLDGTVDHRRPVTPLSHLVEDERADIEEDDKTHFEEILELTDYALTDGMTRAEWSERLYDNINRRSAHHHVFTTHSAVKMVTAAGWTPVMARGFWPYDILILARNGGEATSPRVVSPFRSDR